MWVRPVSVDLELGDRSQLLPIELDDRAESTRDFAMMDLVETAKAGRGNQDQAVCQLRATGTVDDANQSLETVSGELRKMV